jgi:alpha-glucoside transport system permease protein
VPDPTVAPGEGAAATAGGAAAVRTPPRQRRLPSTALAGGFLLPALLLLGALVAYPILFTVFRSLFDRNGEEFVGLANYGEMFTSDRTLTAIRNTAIWVAVAPAVVTALGLIFAVLTERVRWSTAFKVVVFMPMAVSFLAAGVIFRLVFEADPERGIANAVVTSVHDVFSTSSQLPGAQPRPEAALSSYPQGGFITTEQQTPDDPVLLPLVGVAPDLVPEGAEPAQVPTDADGLAGVVWLDFSPGGGGAAGEVDAVERGLPGLTVQALRGGEVVAEATTDERGQFSFDGLESASHAVVLPGSNFAAPFRGVNWLGPALVTPSIIVAYIWIWAGFAMVLIAAGLAAIPRDALEAARVDGGTEWQVFRHVTVPLLSPVLLVVLVTLVINVLKVFDLVLIIPPGSVQADANVLALEMWRVSFGGARDQGLGSALAVLLFLLVVPAMAFNIRRFRREQG